MESAFPLLIELVIISYAVYISVYLAMRHLPLPEAGVVIFLFAAMLALLSRNAHADVSLMDLAQYDTDRRNVIEWEETARDSFILTVTEEHIHYDLVGMLGIERKKVYTMHDLVKINRELNAFVHYSFNDFNRWHMQEPIETLILHTGDCKASAALKYHVLRQLGFKDVKILTVAIPTGRGDIGGHALVLLNGIFVFDINYPYVYTYAQLREGAWLFKAFDDKGSYILRHLGE